MGSRGSGSGSRSGSGRSVLIHEFVTGGGLADDELPPSLADEGRAMRLALAAEFAAVPGVRVVMTLDSRFPDEPGPWQVARIGPGQERARFAELAGEVDCTLTIAPETGGILLDRARILDRLGARSLGSSPAAVAVAGNALQAIDRLQRAGVRTPPTLAVSPRSGWPRRPSFTLAELARVCPFVEVPEGLIDRPPDQLTGVQIEHPAVLKPVDGAGAQHTFVLAGEAPWPDPSWSPEVAVLQPWIEGQHRSAAVLVDEHGRPCLLGCASQRIAVDRGRIRYEGGEAPLPSGPAVDRMVDRVVGAIPGLRGWVGIDWIDDGQGDPIVLEVNPRPTTSVVGFLALLRPGMLASAWLGLGDEAEIPLARAARARIGSHPGRPVRFSPDGTLSSPRDGAGP